jgi:hypothetical protein
MIFTGVSAAFEEFAVERRHGSKSRVAEVPPYVASTTASSPQAIDGSDSIQDISTFRELPKRGSVPPKLFSRESPSVRNAWNYWNDWNCWNFSEEELRSAAENIHK